MDIQLQLKSLADLSSSSGPQLVLRSCIIDSVIHPLSKSDRSPSSPTPSGVLRVLRARAHGVVPLQFGVIPDVCRSADAGGTLGVDGHEFHLSGRHPFVV